MTVQIQTNFSRPVTSTTFITPLTQPHSAGVTSTPPVTLATMSQNSILHAWRAPKLSKSQTVVLPSPSAEETLLLTNNCPDANNRLNIQNLFPETLTQIFSYLDTRDKARAAQTCHYFNQILKNRQIWKKTEARLNLKPNQHSTYQSLVQRGVVRVQVLSLKRSLRELTSYVKITHLKLSGCYNVTDYSLNSMQVLPSLLELDLSLCKQITDAGLVHILGKAPNLESLDLGGCCNLTDRAILLIAYGLRELKKLDLRSCYNLTDKALAYLAGEVNITERCEIKTYNFLAKIGLIDCKLCSQQQQQQKQLHRPASSSRGSKVELRKIDELTQFGLTALESLVLQDCQKISDLALQSISKITTINKLNLSFCVNISDNGLKYLRTLSRLQELNLRSCDNISDCGFAILRDCEAIERLDVSFCEKITTLSQTVCRNLRTLSLSACDLDDDALIGIHMPFLETLNLGQCSKITDVGLKSITEKCENLQYIDLYGCSKISTKGLKTLMSMPSLKNVNLGLWKVE